MPKVRSLRRKFLLSSSYPSLWRLWVAIRNIMLISVFAKVGPKTFEAWMTRIKI